MTCFAVVWTKEALDDKFSIFFLAPPNCSIQGLVKIVGPNFGSQTTWNNRETIANYEVPFSCKFLLSLTTALFKLSNIGDSDNFM